MTVNLFIFKCLQKWIFELFPIFLCLTNKCLFSYSTAELKPTSMERWFLFSIKCLNLNTIYDSSYTFSSFQHHSKLMVWQLIILNMKRNGIRNICLKESMIFQMSYLSIIFVYPHCSFNFFFITDKGKKHKWLVIYDRYMNLYTQK